MYPHVENMKSLRSGRPVANQFIIYTAEGVYFQSYSTVIVFVPGEQESPTQLDRHSWDCSVTTRKYRNLFLGETTAETRRKIKSGEYVLADLNR